MKEVKDLSAAEFLADESGPSLLPYDIEGKGRVYIRRISNLEFRQWASRTSKAEGDDLYNDAALIQLCVCDKNGRRLMTENQIPKIASKYEAVILPLTNACCEFNGVGAESKRKIAKNSKTPGDDSSSDSEAGTN